MQPQRSGQRVTAGVLALVLGLLGLGWLGIHKFVLGYTKEGLITLGVSVVTCGLGAVVFTILSVVEGIVYLTKTDEQFDYEYVHNYKGWL